MVVVLLLLLVVITYVVVPVVSNITKGVRMGSGSSTVANVDNRVVAIQ